MNPTIDKSAAMTRVLEAFPGAQRALFRKYHIGGCASCAFQSDETLGALCALNNLVVGEVIEHIKTSHAQDEELQINPAELAELRRSGTVRVLDVRAREEFE